MSRTRVFITGFLAGFVLVLAGTPLLPDPAPNMRAILEVLAAPGVILSLPVINLVQSPVWAVGCIGVLNGVVYGMAGSLIFRLARKLKESMA